MEKIKIWNIDKIEMLFKDINNNKVGFVNSDDELEQEYYYKKLLESIDKFEQYINFGDE